MGFVEIRIFLTNFHFELPPHADLFYEIREHVGFVRSNKTYNHGVCDFRRDHISRNFEKIDSDKVSHVLGHSKFQNQGFSTSGRPTRRHEVRAPRRIYRLPPLPPISPVLDDLMI